VTVISKRRGGIKGPQPNGDLGYEGASWGRAGHGKFSVDHSVRKGTRREHQRNCWEKKKNHCYRDIVRKNRLGKRTSTGGHHPVATNKTG